MNVKISRAVVDDSAGIARVQITSYRTAYASFFPQAYLDHFTPEEQTQDWRDLMSDAQHEPLLIAHNDEREIVGYALGNNHAAEFSGYDSELVALHVLPQLQRNGIGSRLFSEMANQLKTNGASSLMLWTIKENPVRAFYERLDGELIGKKSYEVDAVTVIEVAYGWKNMDALIERLNAKQNGA